MSFSVRLMVDHLLEEDYENLTVLDISEKSLERAKSRLGAKADHVNWIVSDVLDFAPNTNQVACLSIKGVLGCFIGTSLEIDRLQNSFSFMKILIVFDSSTLSGKSKVRYWNNLYKNREF